MKKKQKKTQNQQTNKKQTSILVPKDQILCSAEHVSVSVEGSVKGMELIALWVQCTVNRNFFWINNVEIGVLNSSWFSNLP